jgi:molybdopterin/thiamine biosynthesis adenylyltransferase
MSDADILPGVISALAADGFEAALSAKGVTFRGSVTVNEIDVHLRMEYRDLEFSEPANVFIENPAALPRPVLPHLDEKNELCVVDRRAFVADRYHAAAEARGMVIRTREVIARGLTRHAIDEIAEEFPEHWGGKRIGVEFGAYEGPTEFTSDAGGFVAVRRHHGALAPSGCALMTGARVSFAEHQQRPDTLAEFLEWASLWDATLPNRVIDALGHLSAADPHCIIIAPNGIFGFQLMVSARGQAHIAALRRTTGWRRVLRTPFAATLPLERDRGHRADLDYALGRNGDGMPPLSGKQIVLVGCGSIGGFLARSLAQLGAGREQGRLILVDDDRLATANLGRHVLGSDDVGLMKADACRAQILNDLPGTTVLARTSLVQSQQALVGRADLVIDATGEHGVSEMLNAWMLDARKEGASFPGLLHVWIEGAGAAVQTFVSSDPAFACLRCLQPVHSERGRFSALKEDAPVELRGGCGETPFTPYGPAAPMMAAALAAQHATDWAQGHARPLLRTGRLDWSVTKDVKPANPTVSERCPACRP